MKILVISYDFPYPPTGGSISRDYNLFRELSKYNELHWVNRTIRGNVSEDRKREMKKYFGEMTIAEWNYDQNYFELIKSLFTSEPYIIRRFRSEEMKKLVERMTGSNNYDLILCDHIYLAQYLPEGIEKKFPVIPNNEDCGFSFYRRMSQDSSFIRKSYAKSQWKKILGYEINMLKRFRVYITTSEAEKKALQKYYDGAEIFVAENGVDTNYFRFEHRSSVKPLMIFTAWFGYYPNAQAAVYFAREILPLIQEKIPEAEFYIVGKEPPDEVKALQKLKGVTVTGYVDDIREYFRRASVAVVPLKVGGGTRLKILEAMASGVPVVSTELGAEGLSAVNGRHLFIADSENDFADCTVRLLNDSALSGTISMSARKLVEESYDWEKIGFRLNEYLKSFASNFTRARD